MLRISFRGPLAAPGIGAQFGWHGLVLVRRRLDRQRQRHALARLDERLLRDVGLTAGQARAEASKPIWRD